MSQQRLSPRIGGYYQRELSHNWRLDISLRLGVGWSYSLLKKSEKEKSEDFKILRQAVSRMEKNWPMSGLIGLSYLFD